jgi:hypothetical protein
MTKTKMAELKIPYYQYFVAALPPQVIFLSRLKELISLVKASQDMTSDEEQLGNTTAEVCLIGLAAHFEAYCKNQFASLVNIYPPLIEGFCAKRNGTMVSLAEVYRFSHKLEYQMGTLLAEDYDFGSAKSINSLFKDLIGITPFSKDETTTYAEFLADRNLLVHNGGIFSHKYFRQKFQTELDQELSGDSILVNKKTFFHWTHFIGQVVLKINRVCMNKLQTIIKNDGATISDDQEKAIQCYLKSPP